MDCPYACPAAYYEQAWIRRSRADIPDELILQASIAALDGMHGDRFHLPCINPADIHRCSGIVKEEQMWCLVGGHRWVNSRCDHHPSSLDKALHNWAVNLYKTNPIYSLQSITNNWFNICLMVASQFTWWACALGDGNLDVKVADVDLPRPEVRACPHSAEPRRNFHRRWCQHRVAKMTCTEDDDEWQIISYGDVRNACHHSIQQVGCT